MREGIPYILDIAFRLREIHYDDDKEFYMMGSIADIGDLSTSYGYQELDATGYVFHPGILSDRKLKEVPYNNIALSKGITDYLIDVIPPLWETDDLPVRLYSDPSAIDNSISIGNNPSLVLKKGSKVGYAIINGRLIELKE